MRRRPVRYTLWLARTGAAPRSFSLPVWVPLILVLGLMVWTGVNAYIWNRTAGMRDLQRELASLSQQARQLTLQLEAERIRNNRLSNQAQATLKSLETLEGEINRLRERAGLPKVRLVPTRSGGPSSESGKGGGGGQPPSLEQVWAGIDRQLREYGEKLGDLEPALAEALRREAALPLGVPLAFYDRLTSGFGYRRDPFGRGFEFHNGLDLAAPYGTPVYAAAPGTVASAGWNGVFGQAVEIDHGYGYHTLYGHLSRIEVRPGDHLEKGDLVGQVGSTGRSSGPHLHYTVFRHGVAVDPRPYVFGWGDELKTGSSLE
ncbi:MAG: peptidase M23 [Meiothermus sp.]